MSEVLEALEWRYATKQFNRDKKLSDNQVLELLKVLQLAPSSYGLQPLKFVLVNDNVLREKLLPASFNQPQIVDASHMIVGCSQLKTSEEDVEDYINLMSETRSIELSYLEDAKTMIAGGVKKCTGSHDTWNSQQAYLALGFLLSACAMNGIDACPMEGIDKKAYDEILGLENRGLQSLFVVTLGYRSEDDKYQHAAKVRKPISKLIDII